MRLPNRSNSIESLMDLAENRTRHHRAHVALAGQLNRVGWIEVGALRNGLLKLAQHLFHVCLADIVFGVNPGSRLHSHRLAGEHGFLNAKQEFNLTLLRPADEIVECHSEMAISQNYADWFASLQMNL